MNKTSKWWLSLGFLAGAALVWYHLFPDDDADDLRELVEKATLDRVATDENGKVDDEYFMRLLKFVGKRARKLRKRERKG